MQTFHYTSGKKDSWPFFLTVLSFFLTVPSILQHFVLEVMNRKGQHKILKPSVGTFYIHKIQNISEINHFIHQYNLANHDKLLNDVSSIFHYSDNFKCINEFFQHKCWPQMTTQ